MDLEERARALYKAGVSKDETLAELTKLSGSEEKAEAILEEIIHTENISDRFIQDLSGFQQSGFSADIVGLGCRGDGDFFVHHKIAELIENQDTSSDSDTLGALSIIGPREQDDGGVVQVGDDFITVSVDGMHSRLSHFPFIAGFHVARAAIRDTLVMGCLPKAIFSDIHLANDGDVAKIFDYTAGISAVSELTNIPLVAGSTLRIGGDLVIGDRLTGCVGCVGFGQKLTPRKSTRPGDVLIMTEGAGGGTIATTALYNGFSEIVTETLNLKFITLGQKLLKTELLANIHSLTDVTNGGIRGDAFEIANSAQVRIIIFEETFRRLVNPAVQGMLTKLDIDPMGVSIDSLLIVLPNEHSDQLLKFIRSNGGSAEIVGRVEACDPDAGQNPGVQLVKGTIVTGASSNALDASSHDPAQGQTVDLKPKYREEPYTPIKKVTNITPKDQITIQRAVSNAMKNSKDKKDRFKEWLTKNI